MGLFGLFGAPTPNIDSNKVDFQWKDNGNGGVNYYADGAPISREMFKSGSGQDVGKIESWVGQNRPIQMQRSNGSVLGASTVFGNGGTATPDDLSFLGDQGSELRGLLGQTDLALGQGLTRNEDEYQRELGRANAGRDQQYAAFDDQRTNTNQDKLGAYDSINKNANSGYRSLAQLIGRASGTGSSAYRELLPNVVGRVTSGQRQDVTDTYGKNLRSIDKSKGQYDISFANVLDDLIRQKKDNESTLRSGIEGQRQNLNDQLRQNASAIAQGKGGGYAAVKAASAPYKAAIDASRNSVNSLFDQFRTPYTAKAAVAPTPELSQYTTDRASVNAGQQGADPNNPYAALLRKRLQGQA